MWVAYDGGRVFWGEIMSPSRWEDGIRFFISVFPPSAAKCRRNVLRGGSLTNKALPGVEASRRV
jgi:hypothetical protein